MRSWSRPASPLPCRLIRFLVAEDRSAEGVHDQTGPESHGPCWVRMTPGTPGSQRARAVTTGRMNLQVDAPHGDDLGCWRRPAPGSNPSASAGAAPP
jgi:hypothetical protein